MTSSPSHDLQRAIFDELNADPNLTTSVAGAIFDAAPPNQNYDVYLTLGEEDVTVKQGFDSAVYVHRFRVSVVGNQSGFSKVKEIAADVVECLSNPNMELLNGHLIDLFIDNSRSVKTKGNSSRRVDLVFKALIESN